MVSDAAIPNAHHIHYREAGGAAGRRNAEERAAMRAVIGLGGRDEIAFGDLEVDLRPPVRESRAEAVSLRDIHRPIFAVGTEYDHVAPWRSVYKIHQLADADVTFVLADAGHNRGIVAPPSQAGRHFRIGTMPAHDHHATPEQWLARASPQQGSWWPVWVDWLSEHSSGCVPARTVDDHGLGSAPGSYVHG